MTRTWPRPNRGRGGSCREYNARLRLPFMNPSLWAGAREGHGSRLTRGPPKDSLPYPSFQNGGGGPFDPPPLFPPMVQCHFRRVATGASQESLCL